MVHTDYVFMTMHNGKERVVIGNRKGTASIVYIYSVPEGIKWNQAFAFYEENPYYCPYTIYLNALEEATAREVQKLIEEKQTRKAHFLFEKSLNKEHCLGSFRYMRDAIPDEWFDDYTHIMDHIEIPRFKGIWTIETMDEEVF